MQGHGLLHFVYWLVICGLLTACSGKSWNNPYSAEETTANTQYSSFMEKPKHLDPVRAYVEDEAQIIDQIYEPPLQYHFLRRPYELVPLSARDLPAPQYLNKDETPLSSDAPASDIAYTVYRIKIKPGIRYQPHPAFAKDEHDAYRYHQLSGTDLRHINNLDNFTKTGTRELEAADYVYQIKRLAHPNLDSPIASLMMEHLVGLKDLATRLAKAASEEKGSAKSGYIDLRNYELAGAKVIDRYTYEIKVHGKYAQFLYWLAMHFFAPMPWEADRFYSQPGMAERNITLNWYPVGTGPFMLTENNPNRRIVLDRNPNFHGETYPGDGEPRDSTTGMLSDAGKAMPFLDKVILVLELESIPYWNKFLQGYYDRSGISSDSFDQAIQIDASGEAELTPAMKEKNIKLVSAAEPDIYYMGFNMRDPVVGGDSEQSRKLRQALSIAVDYEEYISIFMNDRGIAAQGPLPPDIFGHKEGQAGINSYVFDWVDGRPKRKSIDEAKRLLAEAGYPDGRYAANGKPLILNLDTASGGPQFKARLDWMRKQFAKINIQLVVRDSDANRFWEKLDKGTAQIFEAGWNADYPDPENFMFLLYGPNGKAEHKGENQTNYANSEFDRLFEAMRNLDNGPERQKIIDRMVEILRQDAPWVFGFHRVSLTLHHAWYRNAKPIFMANNTLKYRRIDPELRAEMRAKWNRPIVWPVILVVLILVLSALPAIRVFRQAEEASAL